MVFSFLRHCEELWQRGNLFCLTWIASLTLAMTVVAHKTALAGYELDYIGDQIVYSAAYEDTFVHLARDYNLGFVEMRAANPDVDPWIPGEGTALILPTRHLLPDAPREGLVINLPEMRLYAYVNGDDAPGSFPLGVGREGLETPSGRTEIIRKQAAPVWMPTKRMREENPELPKIVYPGDDNPLGTHALYLGWKEYAIHGTNRPFGIGRRVSSGCIRLYPEAIVKLYDMAEIGMPVYIINQPIKLGWIDDVLFLEVSPTLDQALEIEEKGSLDPIEMSDADKDLIQKVAGDAVKKISWKNVSQAFQERQGIPVAIGTRGDGANSRIAQTSIKSNRFND